MKRLLAAMTLSILGVGAVGCAGGSVSYRRGYHARPVHHNTYVKRECYEDRWGDVHCRDVRYRRY